MTANSTWVPERALAIGAHPDDIEFGAGGTIARWTQAGCHVVMVAMTDGSKGSWDPDVDQTALVRQRVREQESAAAVLGVREVVMLGNVDGELENSMALRSSIAELIRAHRPDVVLSHDPWAPYELHPDHRATGWAVVDGAVAARDHLFFPEHDVDHHRPEQLLLWRAAEPNHWEDIASTFELKIEALLCHESQHDTTMNRAGTGETERAAFVKQVRAWAAAQGASRGIEAAEAFRAIPL